MKLKIYFPTETFQEGRKESECVKVSSLKKLKFIVSLLYIFFMLYFIIYFVNILYIYF